VIVKKVDVPTACAVCGRTLLLGEKAVRYSSGADDPVDVCVLCTDDANVYGWVREGSPTAPVVSDPRVRRRRFPSIQAFLEGRRHEGEPVLDEPVLRRLTETEQAMIQAAEVFNASPFRRTVAGIAKSLGDPRTSFLLLSGTNPEVVLTIAWDLSWYQYRIVLGGSHEQVRLAERGYELDDLDARFQAWNGSLDPTGSVTPDIPRF
jgi:hypothetical protein